MGTLSPNPASEPDADADALVRLLLESTGEGIYGIDMEGRCTFANPACARLLGFDSADELMGQNMHDLVHHTRPNGDPYPMTECQIYRAFREGRGVHVEDEVMFRRDGERFWAEYWSYPMRRGEEFLYTHPAIRDVQVFGVPDDKFGEEVCAWIQLKDGEEAQDTGIVEFCKGQIAHFKIPRHIRFVDAFPMTVTGKIQKFEMRKQMVQDRGSK